MWSKVWQWGWIVILAVLGIYELWSAVDGKAGTPTLTKFVLKWVPWYAGMGFFSWLWIHFAIRYWRGSQ